MITHLKGLLHFTQREKPAVVGAAFTMLLQILALCERSFLLVIDLVKPEKFTIALTGTSLSLNYEYVCVMFAYT